MIQLGIAAFYHDSAACLIQDGKVIAAVEEERFTGIKHDSSFPIESITWLLNYAEITMEEVDQVCWYENPDLKKERVISIFNKRPIRTLFNRIKFLRRHYEEGDVRFVLLKYLNYEGPVSIVDHHISHALFSYMTSPFKDAAIVTVDGVGEWETMTIAHVRNGEVNKISETVFPHSMGMLYSTFTAFLGFKPNEGEYKVMGLAPYGDSQKYFKKLYDLIELKSNGKFEINQQYFTWEYSDQIMFKDSLCNYLGMAPRLKDEPIEQKHKDLAAALQIVYEEVFMHILKYAKYISNSENLCLGGGCAYNGVANNKAYSIFNRIWIPFSPSDSGSAIGACLGTANLTHKVSPYLGPDYDDVEVENELKSFTNIDYKYYTNFDSLAEKTAIAIHEGNVIGWFQDRMEFGARALGNRSILASPLRPEMKDRLNKVIKKREGFRPFAPSCIESEASKFFDIKEPIPYMNQVVKVKKEWDLPSITHVDGSARVQTVNPEENNKYHILLTKLNEISGFPICLNTSFNFKDQTITMTPRQAIERFLDCEMDVLVINNYYITKK